MAGYVPELEHSGREDRGGREQEREPRGVAVIQAASEPCRHAHPIAADPRDQRRGLRYADHPGLPVLQGVESTSPVALHPLPHCELPDLGSAPEALPPQQDESVDDQEDRGCERLRQCRPHGMFEEQPEDAYGDRGGDDQPGQPLGRCLDLALAKRAEEGGDDQKPVAPEVDQQSDGAPHVKHHHERQPRRLGLGLPGDDVVPPEQRREQDGVAEARDREELGRTLKHPEHNRLKSADQVVAGVGGQRKHAAES